MKVKSIAFLLLLQLLTGCALYKPTGPGTIRPDSLNRLMALSGLEKQVAEMPGMIRLHLEEAKQQGTSIPEPEFEELSRLIENAFQPSEMLDIIRVEMKTELSEAEACHLLRWYASDPGKTITRAEEAGSSPEAYREMQEEAQRLMADEKRVELAEKLADLLNADDLLMQIHKDVALATVTALWKTMHPDRPVPLAAFESRMREQEARTRAEIEQFLILSSVYRYRAIDIATLEKYLEFNQHPATMHFNDVVMKGISRALARAIENMSESLALMLRKRAGN